MQIGVYGGNRLKPLIKVNIKFPDKVKVSDELTVGCSPLIVVAFGESCAKSTGAAAVGFSAISVEAYMTAQSPTRQAGVTKPAIPATAAQ